jgi:hypothetical protein
VKLTTPHVHARWLEHGTAALTVEDTVALQAVRAWVDDVPDRWLLVLASSTTGSGKSLAAAWAQRRLEELLDQGDPSVARAEARGSGSFWINAAALPSLDGLRPWEREERLQRCRRAWLLVIDDMGTEPTNLAPDGSRTKGTDWAGVLQGVLEVRHAEQRLTLCTTNLVGPDGRATKDWHSRYDRRWASRMATPGDAERKALTSWVHCTGHDLRGRTQPTVVVPAPDAPAFAFDVDSLVAPLLAATEPAVLERRAVEEKLAELAASAQAADAVRRKVWGSLALQRLAELAVAGNALACDVLDDVARRAVGGGR